MRITIDTDTNTIILPNTYFEQIDKMNAVLKQAGAEADKKIDYTQYVKDEFSKAAANPYKRQSDIVKPRSKNNK